MAGETAVSAFAASPSSAAVASNAPRNTRSEHACAKLIARLLEHNSRLDKRAAGRPAPRPEMRRARPARSRRAFNLFLPHAGGLKVRSRLMVYAPLAAQESRTHDMEKGAQAQQ